MSYRRGAVAALFAVALLTITSCSTAAAGKPSSSAPGSTPVTTSAPPSSTTSPTWSPPDYGAAQPAVDAYMKVNAIYSAGLESPGAFAAASLNPYLAGQAKDAFDGSVRDELAHGRAFRGTPPSPRVLVASSNTNGAVPEVVLSDCPMPSASSPWTEYVVATRKAVPTAVRNPPPPYAATIKVFRPVGTAWVITSFTLDGSQTCTR